MAASPFAQPPENNDKQRKKSIPSTNLKENRGVWVTGYLKVLYWQGPSTFLKNKYGIFTFSFEPDAKPLKIPIENCLLYHIIRRLTLI